MAWPSYSPGIPKDGFGIARGMAAAWPSDGLSPALTQSPRTRLLASPREDRTGRWQCVYWVSLERMVQQLFTGLQVELEHKRLSVLVLGVGLQPFVTALSAAGAVGYPEPRDGETPGLQLRFQHW